VLRKGLVPMIPTPPYPEYPSGYTVFASAESRSLANLVHTRHLRLTLTSTAVGEVRHYDSGRALRQDVVDARVWLGIHFRFGDTAARDIGSGSPTGRWTTTSSPSTRRNSSSIDVYPTCCAKGLRVCSWPARRVRTCAGPAPRAGDGCAIGHERDRAAKAGAGA
jgi:hypothetical protein